MEKKESDKKVSHHAKDHRLALENRGSGHVSHVEVNVLNGSSIRLDRESPLYVFTSHFRYERILRTGQKMGTPVRGDEFLIMVDISRSAIFINIVDELLIDPSKLLVQMGSQGSFTTRTI
ncbi:unnamed protein product [Linum trigynum]|uniref:Uncharacterized protein n=1 Tax=Linum trigynum TaxID=586398 RepID=A0AAV2EFA8_9ROSI